MWERERECDSSEIVIMLTAIVGSYVLAVVLDSFGRVTWSVGEGDLGEHDPIEGIAPDIECAQEAALAEARRRWRLAGEAIDALELATRQARESAAPVEH